MRVDWLIVGAGFTGAVLAERIAAGLGRKVLVIDERSHLGGNAYDEYDRHGVLLHKYGPHIFHTNSARVWDYLSRFTRWRRYEHRVLAVVEGQKVPVPFNLRSLRLLFPPQAARRLAELLQAHYGPGAAVPILKMRESPRPQIRRLAEWVYEKIYYGYTLKQWGLSPERLDPSVLARVPVRVSEDDRYFLDAYQGVPEHGYTEMFRRLLSHPNITVALNTEFLAVAGRVRFQRLIYTGAIDRFFGYARGELPYRSLRFAFAHHDREFVQETAQVNYPNDHAHTRITEYKHITGQRLPGSTLALEYPEQHVPGRNEPYYPIPKRSFRLRYEQYLKEAGKLNGTVRFAGRLGDYRYYNMDQAVARALQVFERLLASEAAPRRRREWFFLERYDQPSPQERQPCSLPSS